MKCEGRVLPAQKLEMKRLIEPRNGSWGLREEKFNDSRNLVHWAIVDYVDIPEEDIE